MKKCVICNCEEVDYFSVAHEPMGIVERNYVNSDEWKAEVKKYPLERYVCLDCGYTCVKVANVESYKTDMKYFEQVHVPKLISFEEPQRHE